MIHLINFLVKVIASVVWFFFVGPMGLITLIIWDIKVLDRYDDIIKLIWKKQIK
tara:strand:- start:309 stop:470 length:162 start_codon:yes stop_codon:yes gene_type:complete